ncbi:MAG: helix-turn-helix transcriptional regulator [Candidatus Thorarchaeota archaeon]|nr:helix-turn-helix transcriptional regulator [Candidatus Thorarchaeota archaeon]
MSKESRKALEEYERWSTEVKRGAASLAILAVLDEQTAYGYEIVKQLSARVSFLQLEQGTVYPLLRRLEQRGLLVGTWNYDDPTKPKKYYGLTQEGRRALAMMTDTWNTLSEEMTRLIGAEAR